MQSYVLGFVFDIENPNLVALIRKDRPEWQAGLLNGVGGKVEEGETPAFAMFREALEEISLCEEDWTYIGAMDGADWDMRVYRTDAHLSGLRQMESEELVVCDYRELKEDEVITNLMWLVPYARYYGRYGGEMYINVMY